MTYVTVSGEARFESVEAPSGQIFDHVQETAQDVVYCEAEMSQPGLPPAQLAQLLAQLSEELDDAASVPPVKDISYRAARVRNGLPRGIELLESPPVEMCEETLSASIRRMMVDQKREKSLSILPELEPADARDLSDANQPPAQRDATRGKGFRLDGLLDILRVRPV